MPPRKSDSGGPLRLKIEPVVAVAEALAARVRTELPSHDGLAMAASGVADAARQAERVSQSMKSPLSLHRLPALFLAAALVCLALWIYWRFFYVATLTIALPDRDATELRDALSGRQRVHFRPLIVPGSREAADEVKRGAVDLAFVQGGIEIPPELPRLQMPSPELVLLLLRDSIPRVRDVKLVLTSSEGEGSHSVLLHFAKIWGIDRELKPVFEWQWLTDDVGYEIPGDVDAVFVVKDPADEKTRDGMRRALQAGFRLVSPELGARARRLDFLQLDTLPRGHIDTEQPIPAESLPTYAVATFLVARRDLTPRLLTQAAHVLDARPVTIAEREFNPTTADASEIFQGIEAFMGIIVNIGLAFLALLGLDVMTYRKQFHELNSLVSLLSMLQSNKDVLGLADSGKKAENLLYLGLVSDSLGVLSMISSYYTQENSSLLFNNLSEVIHQRCDGLKINIQLKILHATVELPQGMIPAPE
jgi:hypothetical protein